MASKLIVSLLVVVSTSLSEAWNYKEQDEWPSVYCQKAVAQSPINIQSRTTTKLKVPPLVFTNWDQEYNVSVTNTGHTIRISFPSSTHIYISGGTLPGKFKLVEFHFHWDAEHTINEQRLAFETHFVTYNDKYSSIDEAVNYTNGVAVLGILYQYSEKSNTELQPIIEQIGNLKQVEQTVNIRNNPSSLLPNDVKRFYRYFGSLTTPDCNDVVVWTIFKEFRKITKHQVDKFRTIMSSEGDLLTENVRKIQDLNGRTVYQLSTSFF